MSMRCGVKKLGLNWGFVFGFIFVFSFFTQKISIDIGFHLKAFMFFSVFVSLYLYLVKNKVKFNIEYYEIILLAFIMYGGCTAIYASDLISTLRMFVGSLVMFFCYISVKIYFLNYNFKILDVERIFYLASLSFIIISLVMYIYGMYIISDDFKSYEHVRVAGVFVERATPRLIGLVNDPNIFVVFATPLFFYSLFKINKSFFYFIALTLTALCILLSLSRGGILAITLIAFMCFLLRLTMSIAKGRLNKKTIFWFFILSVTTIIVFYFLNVSSSISSIIEKRVSTISSGSGRIEIWKNLLSLWSESPIFGIGWYNFLHYNIELFGRENYAHNAYLEVLVETGVIGFAIYLSFILAVLYKTIVLTRKNPELNYLFCSLLSILVSFMFLSLIINEIFFLLLAIISVFSYKEKYSGFENQIKCFTST